MPNPLIKNTVFMLLALPALLFVLPGAADNVQGTDGNDAIAGSAGADELQGNDGDDDLVGGKGDDDLTGGAGDDALSGGEGDDVLVGGPGTDDLWGGPGADRFVIDVPAGAVAMPEAPDRIFDFRPEEGDVVVLRYVNLSDRKMGMENIYLNSRGELRMTISDPDGDGLVNIFRSDMEFKYEVDDREVVLRFNKTF